MLGELLRLLPMLLPMLLLLLALLPLLTLPLMRELLLSKEFPRTVLLPALPKEERPEPLCVPLPPGFTPPL